MRINTRPLFKALLKRCRADCVLDIGSMDGHESLLFRQVLPNAVVAAFEANPRNYAKMAVNPNLRASQIEVFPYALSNKRGTAAFYVADVDYDDPGTNRGTSSLLADEGSRPKETVEVQTWRIDEFVLSRHPDALRIGLWVDVEGAEFGVLQGIAGIKERVVAVHVETARRPMRPGQRVYSELEPLMKSFGFVPVGTNMAETSSWGDVVFVNQTLVAELGLRLHLCRTLAALSGWRPLGAAAAFLNAHCGALYRVLYRVYLKLFT